MAGSSNSLQVDDAQEPSEVYFGSLRAKVVGLRYYNGVVSRGEACIVQRQPLNQYDRYEEGITPQLPAPFPLCARAKLVPCCSRVNVEGSKTPIHTQALM